MKHTIFKIRVTLRDSNNTSQVLTFPDFLVIAETKEQVEHNLYYTLINIIPKNTYYGKTIFIVKMKELLIF